MFGNKVDRDDEVKVYAIRIGGVLVVALSFGLGSVDRNPGE
jgi:hypothetical protein